MSEINSINHRFDSIQKLSLDDMSEYKELRLRGLKEHPDAFGETFEHFQNQSVEQLKDRHANRLATMGNEILVALSTRGELIGTVGLACNIGDKNKHIAELWGMYVIPEARGQQVGEKLIQELINHASNFAHIEQIKLGVVVTNTSAVKLYEKMGFVTYGTEPRAIKVDDNYYDEFLMIRYL